MKFENGGFDKLKKIGKYGALAVGLTIGAGMTGKLVKKEYTEWRDHRVDTRTFDEIMGTCDVETILNNIHDSTFINPGIAREVGIAVFDSIAQEYGLSEALISIKNARFDEKLVDPTRLEAAFEDVFKNRTITTAVGVLPVLQYADHRDELFQKFDSLVKTYQGDVDVEEEIYKGILNFHKSIRFSKDYSAYIKEVVGKLRNNDNMVYVAAHADAWLDQSYASDIINEFKKDNEQVLWSNCINAYPSKMVENGFGEEIVDYIQQEKHIPKFPNEYVVDFEILECIKTEASLWLDNSDMEAIRGLMYKKEVLDAADSTGALYERVLYANLRNDPSRFVSWLGRDELEDVLENMSEKMRKDIREVVFNDPKVYEWIAEYPAYLNTLPDRHDVLEKVVKVRPGSIFDNWWAYQNEWEILNDVAKEVSHYPESFSMLFGDLFQKKIFFWNKDEVAMNAYNVIIKNMNQEIPYFLLEYLESELSSKQADSLTHEAIRRNPEILGRVFFKPSNEKDITRLDNSLTRRTQKIIANDPLFKNLEKALGYLQIHRDHEQIFEFLPILHQANTVKFIQDNRSEALEKELVFEMYKKYPDYPSLRLKSTLSRFVLADVQEMNENHELPDSLRFKSLESMDAEQIYLHMVHGEEEVFTSTFNGMFNKMMQKLTESNQSTYSFFEKTKFNNLHIFIRECASYDRLDQLLGGMSDSEQKIVLEKFIASVDVESGNMKEAVSVADVISLVKNPKILDVFENGITKKYQQAVTEGDLKSKTAYGLLGSLLESHAPTGSVFFQNLHREFPIKSLEKLDHRLLESDQGKIMERLYFYNDEDGEGSFLSFLRMYRNNPEWTIQDFNTHITISSKHGKPLVMIANKPKFEEEGNERIDSLLEAQKVKPKVIIHRGHSYHAGETIREIDPETKFVYLGSCGGYSNLTEVLSRAPDAQIFATKGTGTMKVNDPLIFEFNNELVQGKSLIWNDMANNMEGLGDDERFKNYIFPNKNLGVLYLKSYQDTVWKSDIKAK